MINSSQNTKQVSNVPKVNTISDYLLLFKNNLLTIFIISAVIFSISIVYALTTKDEYKAITTIKVTRPEGNILKADFGATGQSFGNDRFIANEIEAIKNVTIREQIAQVIVDSLKSMSDFKDYYVSLNFDNLEDNKPKLKSYRSLASSLLSNVEIIQKNNLDFIEIASISQSPDEAALISNSYAKVYQDFNLLENRKQLTKIKNFLENKKDEKLNELRLAEERIKNYKLEKGVVQLDRQSELMVTTLSEYEKRRNTIKIDMAIAEETLNGYKSELRTRNPSLEKYLKNQTSQLSLKTIQDQIANLQNTRYMTLIENPRLSASSPQIKQYDKKIADFNAELSRRQNDFMQTVESSSPEEYRELVKIIFEEEVKYQTLVASYNVISSLIEDYNKNFNKLPKSTLDLARLERERRFHEDLYSILEKKHQEAIINEQSVPGNVLILNEARAPYNPFRPNRLMIGIIGLFAGLTMGFGFIYVKNYFDKTIKSPDDILYKNQVLIGWIPKFTSEYINTKFLVAEKPDSIPSEAFRSLRTRLNFSQLDEEQNKVILITSSAPQDGKTTISTNLAGSFALSNKRTILLDCDLRIPRVHSFFSGKKAPGFTDYIIGRASFDKIVRPSGLRNLEYISAGTIPPNPSEILSSSQMRSFVQKLKNEYDVVIIDSPPVMAVTDSEILSRIVDSTILVVSANKTEMDWLDEASELLKHETDTFAGVILNKFDYKSGYRSYYKYYQYYSSNKTNKKT